MVNYSDLRYEEVGDVIVPTREDLMLEVMRRWKEGIVSLFEINTRSRFDLRFTQLQSARIPVKRRRELVGCGTGEVRVALNGRVGRRIACLVNETGSTLEAFDLEGDGEDGDGEEDST
jgi:anaphase-promoting complex subunit 4